MKKSSIGFALALLTSSSCAPTAKLKITATPPNTRIIANGLPICMETPCEVELPKGNHSLSAQRKDYQLVEKPIVLQKDSTINFELTPAGGWLNVKTQDQSVMISVNHKMIGLTPLKELFLKAGKHSLRTHSSCHEPIRKEVNIQNGKTQSINLKTSPYLVNATITVIDDNNKEVSASIFIDGVAYGKSPSTTQIPKCAQTIYAQADNQQGHVILKNTQEDNIITVQLDQQQALKPLEQLLGYTPPECRSKEKTDQKCIERWLKQKQIEIEEQDAHLHHDGCKH